jgi:segregation and condensation protein B
MEKLKSIIESLLFVSGEPVKVGRLAKICEAPKAEVENALMALSAEFSAKQSGFSVIRRGDEVQLATNPAYSSYVEKMVKGALREALTPAALEVASIIAYRGPVTRSNIEAIRGVNSSYVLRNLLMRGLVERKENPRDARSYIYEISFDFLKALGIENARRLPDFEKLSRDPRAEAITNTNPGQSDFNQ